MLLILILLQTFFFILKFILLLLYILIILKYYTLILKISSMEHPSVFTFWSGNISSISGPVLLYLSRSFISFSITSSGVSLRYFFKSFNNFPIITIFYIIIFLLFK